MSCKVQDRFLKKKNIQFENKKVEYGMQLFFFYSYKPSPLVIGDRPVQ